ncbi:MAG TPA: hypothetical protein VHO91_17335, partial [Rhodopila sp.]|nr:hypothetical protein [Rhodopila sp.]
AIVIGLTAPVLIALVGTAIDFSGVLAAKTKLELSADAGSLAGIMAASNALVTDPNNYLADGVSAGEARFNAQAGRIPTVGSPIINVSLTRSGTTIIAKTNWAATYKPFFGRLFGVTSWPLTGSSSVIGSLSAPYLNIEIMLDNSPSMEIGATNSDIATLQQLTPCATGGSSYTTSPGAIYNTSTAPPSGQWYNAYQCSSGGINYSGSLACPIPANAPYTFSYFNPSSSSGGPSCQGYLSPISTGTGGRHKDGGSSGTQYPQAGAPCAFACHFDTSKPAGQGNDYYAIARSTIGATNQVTLRFDVVKSAVNNLITTMQSNDLSIKNLKVGVFTFDHALTQVYPPSGEAGDDWTTALADVGGPPTVANGPDTGIQPYGGDNGGDTDFPDAMTSLASQLTASGDGMTATTPRKVLFMITDGVQDYTDSNGNRQLAAMDPSYCQTFKNMGYVVYVLYTPYYPLMNGYYLQNMSHLVEGTGPGSVSYNLQSCASAPQDYIQASDAASIKTALQTFFQSAVSQPAKFSK